MAMTPEARVKAQCRKVLDTHGAYYFFPATGGFGRSGVPDIIGSYKGRFFAIECKAGKGTVTMLQEREIRRINESGAKAIVVNEENLGDVVKLLESL